MAALGMFTAARPALAQHGGHGRTASVMHGSSNGKTDKGSSSAIGDKLQDNTKLAAKLQSLLPTGTNLTTASSGFKNLGQFVAAVHVANNLDITFTDLKNQMMGPPKESLGKAIHTLRPDVDSKSAVNTANKQAKQDLNDSKSS
jgi:hypothetical protein